ncbi:MAG: hypothetical protein Q4F17_07795 [Eubacteriales bacterium]|nr:hypothetical protein [Eubacteriales bacterium]
MAQLQKRRLPPGYWLAGMVVFCIFAYLVIFAIMNIYGYKLFSDADKYADTLLSRLMWEEKTLFPDGWVFSNQYYVVATPVLAALFYGVTGNVNTAMVLATELMTLFIIVSFLWMTFSFTEGTAPGRWLLCLFGLLLLICSTMAPDIHGNRPSEIFFLQASYYACYLIGFFVVVGDYARTFRSRERRLCSWGLALFLSFALGIQSLRQTVAMILPLLAYEIFLALRRLCLRQPLWTAETRPSLFRAISYAAANVLGIFTVSWIDPLHSSLYGSFQLTPLDQLWPRIQALWPAFQVISGLKYSVSAGYSPFFTVFSLVLIGIVAAAILLWLANIRKSEGPLEICWLVCLIGLLGTALSTVVIGINIRDIYLFLWYPLVALSGIILMKHLPRWSKGLLIVLICLLSLVNLRSGYTYGAQSALLNSPSYAGKAFRLIRDYGFKSYATIDEDYHNTEALCDWAMAEGYDYVYGDWYTAPEIAVHSGGRLAACHWWIESVFVPNDRLIYRHFYDDEDNARAVYVFTDRDEQLALDLAAERGVELTRQAEFGKYTAYTSPVQLFTRTWD